MVTATGTAVLLDPTAAMFIGAGMPPLSRLLGDGVPCGLATNGPAANGAQDMFESMKNAAGLAKLAAQDGRALVQQRALDLATIEGARHSASTATSARSSPASAPTSRSSTSRPRSGSRPGCGDRPGLGVQGSRRARRRGRRPPRRARSPAPDHQRGRRRHPRHGHGPPSRRACRAAPPQRGVARHSARRRRSSAAIPSSPNAQVNSRGTGFVSSRRRRGSCDPRTPGLGPRYRWSATFVRLSTLWPAHVCLAWRSSRSRAPVLCSRTLGVRLPKAVLSRADQIID